MLFRSLSPTERNTIKQDGIPCDSLDNQLADWILFARQSNNNFRVAIKGDKESNFPVVKKVMAALEFRKVHKYNFITNLENKPE